MKQTQTLIIRGLVAIVVLLAVPVSAHALATDYTAYTPGQLIAVDCRSGNDTLQLYDITPGIDGLQANNGYINPFGCGTPVAISFDGILGHSYALLETSPDLACNSLDYLDCKQSSESYGEADFSINTVNVASSNWPSLPTSVSTDNSTYTVGQTIAAYCQYSNDTLQLYDITPGIDGLQANNGYINPFGCGTPVAISFDGILGHSYALLEASPDLVCGNLDYLDCKQSSDFRSEANFNIGDTSVPSSSGVATPPKGLNKSIYAVGENVIVNCQYSNDTLQLYDITSGIDGLQSNGGYINPFGCGTPAIISFDGILGHSYALLETSPDLSCGNLDYMNCRAMNNLNIEMDFQAGDATVVVPGGGPPPPSVTITMPVAGTVFSHAGLVNYQTKNAFSAVIFYTDKLAEWDHLLVNTNGMPTISNNAPAQGPFSWDASALIPGDSYRVIVDAMNAKKTDFTQAVSDIFTVDFDAPRFTVSTDPPATRGGTVAITVDASKILGLAPTTTVTQQGGPPTIVAMTGSDSHYTGTYTVIANHDGIAHISVDGVDMVGNEGTSTVSGGTFAVGVEPPPAPHVSSPLNNSVTGVSTTTVMGTMRADTSIVATVNGTDVYTASATTSGAFFIPNIVLDPKANHGVNIISVVSKDTAGLVSVSVPISIKYNLPPSLSINAPVANATIGGTANLSVNASDPNNDPLQFTYQIVSADEFDAASSTIASSASSSIQSATSTAWTTIANSVPASGFSWDSTEVSDGAYELRVIASDGIAQVVSTPERIFIKNTLPFFRFNDGRKTISGTSTVTVVGHALAPQNISPQPGIVQIQYSLDSGKKWQTVPIISGSSTPSALFSVTFNNVAQGETGILWRAKDTRGLYGRSSHPIVVDTTPPPAPVVTLPQEGSLITSADDTNSLKTGVQMIISGTAQPLSTVALTIASTSKSVVASAAGAFTFRDVDPGARGAHSFAVTATDQAGNTSSTTVTDFIFDDPPVVSITAPEDGHALGTRAGPARISWHITTTEGEPATGVTLSYRTNGGAYHPLPIDPNAGSFMWDVSTFSEGNNYQLTLDANDGLATSSDTVNFSIDNTPPRLDTLAIAHAQIGARMKLAVHGSASDALSGVATVEYAIEPLSSASSSLTWYTSVITNGYLATNAAFSIAYPAHLDDGSYRLHVRAVDAAGNTSYEKTADFLVRTTPPRVGAFMIVENGMDVSPDRTGTLLAYAGDSTTFAISLENDAASASVEIGTTKIPLHLDIASGLWEGSLSPMSSATGSIPIILSASDVFGNAVTQNIGSISFVDHGVVTDASGPLSGARVNVLVLDDRSGSYHQFSSATVSSDITTDSNGIYALILPQESYELIASAPGYGDVTHPIMLDRAAPVSLSFTLEKSQSWWQQLLNAVNNFHLSL